MTTTSRGTWGAESAPALVVAEPEPTTPHGGTVTASGTRGGR